MNISVFTRLRDDQCPSSFINREIYDPAWF